MDLFSYPLSITVLSPRLLRHRTAARAGGGFWAEKASTSVNDGPCLRRQSNASRVLASLFFSLAFIGWGVLDAAQTITAAAGSAETTAQPSENQFAFEAQIQQSLAKVRDASVGFGGGSGVVISPDGFVLTVAHVANLPGSRHRVTFPDGRRVTATILGACDDLDIAVAKIDRPGDYPHVAIERIDVPQVGQWIITLGYPVSFAHGQPAAVRVGRVLQNQQHAFISDCPIMGGDSGGPVFDIRGNLLGVSSRCQDRIHFNVHIPLTKFFTYWQQLCSGQQLALFHDGTMRPRRPPWDAGLEPRKSVRIETPFPAALEQASQYTAARSAVPDLQARKGRQRLPPGRSDAQYLREFDAAKQAALHATAKIFLAERALCSGTLLIDPTTTRPQRYVVTKASLLGTNAIDWQANQVTVLLAEHSQPIAAEMLGVDHDIDLAVFLVQGSEMADDGTTQDSEAGDRTGEVMVSQSSPSPAAGTPVICVRDDGRCLVGFVAAEPRSFAMRQPPLVAGRAMLGVSVTPVQRGVQVTHVISGTGAEQAGLREGDILQTADERPLRSADDLISLVAQRNVGSTLEVRRLRDETVETLQVTLGKYIVDSASRPGYDNWGGGPFSDRRFEIPHVLAHDTAIAPEDCGRPLVDSRGNIVGVNIARALRAVSYALPINDVWQAVSRMQQM